MASSGNSSKTKSTELFTPYQLIDKNTIEPSQYGKYGKTMAQAIKTITEEKYIGKVKNSKILNDFD